MAKEIIIFGPSGSGKSTLGRKLAERLDYPYFDLDDYIWRKDTEQPFTVMYSREEKIGRLMTDISRGENFVMAGSMSSFHQPFDPLFDLAVHLNASAEIRLTRIHQRELEYFGQRILEGGDMYVEHQSFLDNSARYDTDGSPNLSSHMAWAEELTCSVLKLDGARPWEEKIQAILNLYGKRK